MCFPFALFTKIRWRDVQEGEGRGGGIRYGGGWYLGRDGNISFVFLFSLHALRSLLPSLPRPCPALGNGPSGAPGGPLRVRLVSRSASRSVSLSWRRLTGVTSDRRWNRRAGEPTTPRLLHLRKIQNFMAHFIVTLRVL